VAVVNPRRDRCGFIPLENSIDITTTNNLLHVYTKSQKGGKMVLTLSDQISDSNYVEVENLYYIYKKRRIL